MKVSEHVEKLIQSRPYKYTYKQTLVRDVKKLGIWDMNVEEVTSAYIRDTVDALGNHNSRRRLYITARSIFKELDKCQDLPVLESISRIYQFPEQEHLDYLISKSKYRLQLFLCMYGGLRLGEACAVTPKKLEGVPLELNLCIDLLSLKCKTQKSFRYPRTNTHVTARAQEIQERTIHGQ